MVTCKAGCLCLSANLLASQTCHYNSADGLLSTVDSKCWSFLHYVLPRILLFSAYYFNNFVTFLLSPLKTIEVSPLSLNAADSFILFLLYLHSHCTDKVFFFLWHVQVQFHKGSSTQLVLGYFMDLQVSLFFYQVWGWLR